jgi:hypothetical protein
VSNSAARSAISLVLSAEPARDRETPLDRTEGRRHDGCDGNPGLFF